MNDDEGKGLFVHRTAGFDRSLEDLLKMGGTASMAAKKAEEVVCRLANPQGKGVREQFRLTRNGEYRIKYCRKYDLGSGYRLVFLRKDQDLVLLYVGSHDDCFRWIERNKGMKYKTDESTSKMRVLYDPSTKRDSIGNDGLENKTRVDEYEAALMSRIDDRLLRKIFSGLVSQ